MRAAIRRYSKPLADLVARDANEGDTRLLVTSIRTFHHWLRAQRLSWPVVMQGQAYGVSEAPSGLTMVGSEHCP